MPLPPLPPPPPPQVELVMPSPYKASPDIGQDASDFNVGDVELKVRVGVSGNSYSPLTIVSSVANWLELGATLDVGVLEVEYLSFGLGAEAYVTRPWLPEAVTPLWSAGGADLNWRVTDRGVVPRLTLHYTWLSSFDPYLVALCGPTYATMRTERADPNAVGRYSAVGLRWGVGGGINVVGKDRVTGGLELRYLMAHRFGTNSGIPMADPDGLAVDSFDIDRAQRPPRGFSWVGTVGYRF